MPSHGDFNVAWGATTTFTAANKMTMLSESDIEIVEWGFLITTAGAWNGTACLATLEVADADGGNPVLHSESFFHNAASVPVGSRLYVRPATPIQVGPGKRVDIDCSQVGAATAGAGAPFIVYRRKSFHADRQTGDTNVTI
jgi:hypothetical protein